MFHALPGTAAIVLAATLAATSAQTELQTGSAQRTVWGHNGSVVYLVANGASREFYYQKPRPGMLDAGARPGSLLFRGEVNSGQYVGTAYIFNPLCGPIPFEVKGLSLDGDERIVLTGQAPRVGRNCRSYTSYTSTLEFRRANQSQEALTAPQPPSTTAKPELQSDVSRPPGETVEAVAAVAHHLAGLTDIAKLLGKLQQSYFGADDLLLGGHGVLQSPRRGAAQPRPAPRPASACDSPWRPGHHLSD